MNDAVLTLSIFAAALLISMRFYRQILVILCLIFYAPVIANILILKVAFQLLSCWNDIMLAQGRFTIWFKRANRLHIMLLDLEESLLSSIVSFLQGEKMAITIQRPGTIVEYVPVSERELPVEKQTVVLFEKLPRKRLVEERDRLVSLSERGRVEALRSSSVSHKITMLQLAGWRNLLDEEGNEIPFDKRNKEQMYDLLPPSLQDELEDEFGGGVSQAKAVEEEQPAA
jgi:hypothetical protein